jgi:hypothetical protein
MENKRHEELSDKIFKMGFGLHEEGQVSGDYIISSIGDFMILISGLIHDKDDVMLFGEICGMFSAKKILDAQMSFSHLAPKDEGELSELLNQLKNKIDEKMSEEDNDDDDDDDENNDDLGTNLGDKLK